MKSPKPSGLDVLIEQKQQELHACAKAQSELHSAIQSANHKLMQEELRAAFIKGGIAVLAELSK